MGNFDRYYNENGEIDATRVAVPTAIKTLFVIFVSGVLIMILIMGMLPLSSMRFFESIGLKDRALEMATIAAKREQKRDSSAFSRYADALYYKMVLSEELHHNGGRKGDKYLHELCDSTLKYASIKGIDERNDMIDSNNLLRLAPLAHASIYSFSDRVSNLNYYASIRLGIDEGFLIGNNVYSANSIKTMLEALSENTLKNGALIDGRPTLAMRYSVFFGQLTEYIQYNIENQSDLELLTKEEYGFMQILEQKLCHFKDYALLYLDNFDKAADEEGWIFAWQTQLYLTRSVARLYDMLCNAAVYLELDHEQWRGYASVNGISMMEYFVSEMLPSYIESYYNTKGVQI